MADAADTATAAVNKVKNLIALLAALTGKSESTDTATAASSANIAGAHAAVAAYRKTARWIVAALSAVALIIFGTLPFFNVTRLPDTALLSHALVWLGLFFVGLGVVLAVSAVASTMTPVRASLGELAAETQPRQGHPSAMPSAQGR
ncbi:hypothetical protein SAMN05660657_01479 [Geodermatophilus amargosae]|uniref:Uncharacterized protein n=2 Tax=Geodermatophilus amargosae TaxID=1296565 RepID=A0A1I6YYC1_9ACTN|nr:hypothetical protein SAMN05660657_01479 [Geodermatophilus amargosae]